MLKVVEPEIRVDRRVEKKEQHVMLKSAGKLSKLRREYMFGYTGHKMAFVSTIRSASGVAERFLECHFGTIYQTGQVAVVITQETFLSMGLEFQHMFLAFRSQ